MGDNEEEEEEETSNPKARVSHLHKAEVLVSGLRGLGRARVASIESSVAVVLKVMGRNPVSATSND